MKVLSVHNSFYYNFLQKFFITSNYLEYIDKNYHVN